MVTRRAPLRALWAASLAAGGALHAGGASADLTKAQCAEANAAAQDLRRDGKLTAARENLLQCAAASCPEIVRDDCARRLDDLEKAQPTIVFEVKDGSGSDVFAVSVSLDGKAWANSIEGKSLAADPGKHVFVFRAADYAPVTLTIVLTEGEKGRRERIVLEGRRATSQPASATGLGRAAGTSAGAVSASGGANGMGGQKTLGLAAGGVGIAGLGLGAVFGLMTLSAWSQAKSVCGGDPSHCTDVAAGQSQRNTAETDATISTAGFIAGGFLVAAGAVLFLAARRDDGTPANGLALVPAVGPTQAGLALTGVLR